MNRSQERRLTPRLTDEALEYYGDVYVTRGIREVGVEFENFLTNPDYYIAKYHRGDGQSKHDRGAGGLRRLLRAWAAARTSTG